MDGSTRFRVWSPWAESVVLHLYREGADGAAFESRPLNAGPDGVWEVSVGRELHGIYYDYDVVAAGSKNRTADPYARACGVNGMRSMVVDLEKTNPRGWDLDRAPDQGAEDIIYELHVKEFSWGESAGCSEAARGKYTAFLETDTTLYGDGIHPTGIAYLKKLGVTHIQLMPVFDYGSVDEAGEADQFNWGYDPVNYNVPEGSYSTDPFHGEVRIRELKEMVMSLHKQGFRVIMDVVYNHTYSADSWLERTVPGYYYRRQKDGTLANGSGCGNDLASEKTMCSRYILDSVLYWAEEYHMDGFRFDLMGLLDVKLMNRIQRELDLRFGTGEKLIYGEPWRADRSPMEKGSIPALKENVRKLDAGIGMFCDGTRDAIRGHVFEAEIPGFVNGGKGLEEVILHGPSAWCDKDLKVPAKAPSQIITYASAHDNMTLWDKLVVTMTDGRDFDTRDESVFKACKLAAAICYTCQGRMFLLSGEEFARTKDGIEDSYRSPIEINRLDWERAYENRELVEYYRGLMALRKQLPGLCDKSETAVNRISNKKTVAGGCVSFCVDNTESGKVSRWSDLFVVYNSSQKPVTVTLPAGGWELLLDGKSSSLWSCGNQAEVLTAAGEADASPVAGRAELWPVAGQTEVSPVSALVLGKR